jgi:hypothetical protein
LRRNITYLYMIYYLQRVLGAISTYEIQRGFDKLCVRQFQIGKFVFELPQCLRNEVFAVINIEVLIIIMRLINILSKKQISR